MPTVINARDLTKSEYRRIKSGVYKHKVYVGRPSKWGNPYQISKSLRREDACRMFAESVVGRETEIRNELKGKDLVCWCAPEACHADILLKIANED